MPRLSRRKKPPERPPFVPSLWFDYTPTVTAVTGTITTVLATARYLRLGPCIFIKFGIVISNNGTGADGVVATLPVDAVSSGGFFVGQNTTPVLCYGTISAGDNGSITIYTYDGLYPGGALTTINISGFYESPTNG